MRRLSKHGKPAILEEREQIWQDEFRRCIDGDTSVPKAARRRYAHDEIKAALRRETFGKCAYCESAIRHVAPEHVEHILPKARRPDLVVDWPNLTLACPECNGNKSDYHDPARPLLNPYDQEPDQHLHFIGGLVFAHPGDAMGFRTVDTIGLSRSGLVERRIERITSLHKLLHLWQSVTDSEQRDILERQIAAEASVEREYVATVRAYLIASGFPSHLIPGSASAATGETSTEG